MRNRAKKKKKKSLQTIICKGHILLHCFRVCQSITLGINVLYSWKQNNPWLGPNSIKSQENAVSSSTQGTEMHRYTRKDPHTGNYSMILIIVKIQFASCPLKKIGYCLCFPPCCYADLPSGDVGHPNRWMDDEMHVLSWLSLNTIWLLSKLSTTSCHLKDVVCPFFNVKMFTQRKSMGSNFIWTPKFFKIS